MIWTLFTNGYSDPREVSIFLKIRFQYKNEKNEIKLDSVYIENK